MLGIVLIKQEALMARVTVEDCMKIIPSRFELVVLAAQRAREISSGAKSTIEKDNKEAVISLREIALGEITPEELHEAIVKKNQNRRFISDADGIDVADDGFSGDEIAESLAEMSAPIIHSSLSDMDEEELEMDLDSEKDSESEEDILDDEVLEEAEEE